MKRNIDVSEEKISALEMYLTQKNTTLDDELTKYTEQLYTKTVPQNVRDYIEMMGGKKPVKKPKSVPDKEFGTAVSEAVQKEQNDVAS